VRAPFRSFFTFLEHLREKEREKPASLGGKQEMATLVIEVPEISLDELVRTTNNFGQHSFDREGSHARIYYAVLENKKQVEIKKLDKLLSHTIYLLSKLVILWQQLVIASRLKHKKFVKLLGKKGVRGSRPGPVLSWTQRLRIALDAAKGLQYLHEMVQPSIVHMDIRSSNILLFHNFRAKIVGYDLFKQVLDMTSRLPSTQILGTFVYNAPEYVMTCEMTQKSDVYNFGVVLLEILTRRKPIDETMPRGYKSLVAWVCFNSFMFVPTSTIYDTKV
ncbi:PTI1-like tyrosine-protein kinase 3, partial [Ananas comosus]